MRIRIETQARDPQQIEAAKHCTQVVVQGTRLVVRIYRRPMAWLPKFKLFNRLMQLQEVLVLPLPERASSSDIQTLLTSKSELYRTMGLQLSLTQYGAALKQAQRQPLLGLQVGNVWMVLLLLVLWLAMTSKPTSSQTSASTTATPTVAQSSPAPDQAQTGADAPQAMAAAEQELANQSSIPAVARSTQLGGISTQQAIAVAQKTQGHIVLRKAPAGGDTLVMFLDPLCKHCRAFETVVAHLPSNLGLTVIPVAYQRGSKPLVQQLLCTPQAAKADHWRTLMSDRSNQLKPQANCINDPELARRTDDNAILFARAGMLTTPALVLQSTGKVYTGTDLSLQAVSAWLKS